MHALPIAAPRTCCGGLAGFFLLPLPVFFTGTPMALGEGREAGAQSLKVRRVAEAGKWQWKGRAAGGSSAKSGEMAGWRTSSASWLSMHTGHLPLGRPPATHSVVFGHRSRQGPYLGASGDNPTASGGEQPAPSGGRPDTDLLHPKHSIRAL